LALAGFDVDTADGDGRADEVLRIDPPDAVVLDVRMPPPDGIELCRRLRARGEDVPVLMLSALEDVDDRVRGLAAGADDYVVKPFALRELEPRLRALLRRLPPEGSSTLRVGALRIEPDARTASVDGRTLELTRREFDLLEVFARNSGLVLSRSRLLKLVWGYDFDVRTDCRRYVHQLLAPKARGRWTAAADSHRPGCRLRTAPCRRIAPVMKRWRSGLSTRVAIVVAALVALAVLLAGTVLLRVAERDLLAAQDTQLRAAVRVVAPLAERLRDQTVRPRVTATVEQRAARLDGGLRMEWPDGGEVVVGDLPDASALTAAAGVATLEDSGQRWRILTTELPDGGRLWATAPMDTVDGQLALMRRRIFVIEVLAAGAASVVGLLVGRWLTRPLRALQSRAAEISSGGDGASWPVERMPGESGVAEIDDLALALNDLLASRDAEQHRIEEALRSARSFSATAAHEMRTVDEAVDSARRRHPEAQIDLVAPDELPVFGWREGLRLICDNLITNAIVHGGNGQPPRVDVRLTGAGRSDAVLIVDDVGAECRPTRGCVRAISAPARQPRCRARPDRHCSAGAAARRDGGARRRPHGPRHSGDRPAARSPDERG
jgi:two-component system response regulator PrrA